MIQQVTKTKNFGVKRPNYNYTATFYEHIFHSSSRLENLNMNSTAGMSQSLSHLSTWVFMSTSSKSSDDEESEERNNKMKGKPILLMPMVKVVTFLYYPLFIMRRISVVKNFFY